MAARVTEIFGKISRTMYFTFKAMYFFIYNSFIFIGSVKV